ncbi:unnamed protein product [Linum trigynum]
MEPTLKEVSPAIDVVLSAATSATASTWICSTTVHERDVAGRGSNSVANSLIQGCIGPSMGGLTRVLLYGVGSMVATVVSAMGLAGGTIKEVGAHSCTKTLTSWDPTTEASTSFGFNKANDGTLSMPGIEGHVEVQDMEWRFGFAYGLRGWDEDNIDMKRTCPGTYVRELHGELLLDNGGCWTSHFLHDEMELEERELEWCARKNLMVLDVFKDRSLVRVPKPNWKFHKRVWRRQRNALFIVINTWEGFFFIDPG